MIVSKNAFSHWPSEFLSFGTTATGQLYGVRAHLALRWILFLANFTVIVWDWIRSSLAECYVGDIERDFGVNATASDTTFWSPPDASESPNMWAVVVDGKNQTFERLGEATFIHCSGLWWVFLTNWTFFIVCAYLGCAAIVATWAYQVVQDKMVPPFPKLGYVAYCLQYIASVGSLLVMFAYWTLLYKPKSGWPGTTGVWKHAFHAIFMAIDMMANRQPYESMKFVFFPMVYGCVYALWSLIHSATGLGNGYGTDYIYNVLNWGKSPGMTIGVLVAIVLILTPLFGTAWFFAVAARRRFQGPLQTRQGASPVGAITTAPSACDLELN